MTFVDHMTAFLNLKQFYLARLCFDLCEVYPMEGKKAKKQTVIFFFLPRHVQHEEYPGNKTSQIPSLTTKTKQKSDNIWNRRRWVHLIAVVLSNEVAHAPAYFRLLITSGFQNKTRAISVAHVNFFMISVIESLEYVM